VIEVDFYLDITCGRVRDKGGNSHYRGHVGPIFHYVG